MARARSAQQTAGDEAHSPGADSHEIEAEALEERDPPQTQAITTIEPTAMVARNAIDVDELVHHRDLIKAAMERAMVEGVHYGVIPGVQKPSLFKPGAETLLVLFRLAPTYQADRHYDGTHLTVTTMCRLNHAPTGMFLGEGEGLCTTRESRYAYRQGGRVCPECGADTIIKGRAEYGGGWVCFKKKGGCGAKFDDGTHASREFEAAVMGRVDNPDLPDMWNTVLKISAKRALVAAVLNVTGASDLFTQDMEDMPRDQQRQQQSGEPEPEPVFEPDRDLLENAPRGRTVIADGLKMLTTSAPQVAWPPLLAAATQAVFGKPRADLEEDEAAAFYRRFANLAGRIATIAAAADPNALPTVTNDEVQESVAWAFAGHVLEVPAAQTATDDAHTGASEADSDPDAPQAPEGPDGAEDAAEHPTPMDGEEPLPEMGGPND